MKSLRKSFLKRTSVPKRSAIKRTNPARKRKEFARCYGGKVRVEFVKSLKCAACGVEGYSQNAHVLGNGGMGRKAGYETVAPLCGPRMAPFNSSLGCHSYFDMRRDLFDRMWPDFNPETAAAETEKLWREHNDKA